MKGMTKYFEITPWEDKKSFTISYKEYFNKGKKGIWLYHDPSGKMTGYKGNVYDFKGDSNITHEEIFKLYPEMKDRYIKELIKRI